MFQIKVIGMIENDIDVLTVDGPGEDFMNILCDPGDKPIKCMIFLALKF